MNLGGILGVRANHAKFREIRQREYLKKKKNYLKKDFSS